MDAIERKVRASFGRQGLMSTLGAEMTSVAEGTVEIRIDFDRKLSQQNGFVHGGVITSILDAGDDDERGGETQKPLTAKVATLRRPRPG